MKRNQPDKSGWFLFSYVFLKGCSFLPPPPVYNLVLKLLNSTAGGRFTRAQDVLVQRFSVGRALAQSQTLPRMSSVGRTRGAVPGRRVLNLPRETHAKGSSDMCFSRWRRRLPFQSTM